MADVFKILRGVMGSLFKIGGPSGPNLKNNSGVVEFRNTGDSDFVTARAAHIAAGGSLDDLATLLNLQSRVPNITFSFTGGTPPAPGTNTGQFGICHTTGGSYTQGQVVYDDGVSLLLIPTEVVRTVTTAAAVSGGINLIANGLYAWESGAWVLKGDGTAAGTGISFWIEVPFDFGDTGAGTSSTTNIPDGARTLNARVIVETLFDATPTAVVTVDGSSPETLMAVADSDLTVAGEYHSQETHLITATSAGAVKVVVGGSPTVGAGRVLVEYILAPLG